MAVLLLRFPLLVLKIILMKLTLYETFALATTSKRARKCMKSCLSHQTFTVYYTANQRVTLRRGIWKGFQAHHEDLEFRMVEKSKQKLVYPYRVWQLLGQDSVSVRIVKDTRKLIVLSYWEDQTIAFYQMIEFLLELITKPHFNFYFHAGSPDHFQTTVRFLKGLAVEMGDVCVEPGRRRRRAVHNELMRIALEECRDVKQLKICCENTEQNLEIDEPFTCDWIYIHNAKWVTKEQLVKCFFNCATIALWRKNYEDQELIYIFEQWMTGSKIQFLFIIGSVNFYLRKSLTNIVGQLPGATPVRKAMVQISTEDDIEVLEFEEGRCYLIEQHDGERDALVYLMRDAICLAEDYEIGEDIDKMETDTMEDEDERSGDEEPVVEEMNEEDEEAVESDQDNILYGEYGEAVFEHVQEAPPRIERRNSDQDDSSDEDEDSEEEAEEGSGSESEGDNAEDEEDSDEEDDDSD